MHLNGMHLNGMHLNGRRLVVGAIIVDDLESPTRILAARRSGPPALAGKWEFPGGKVELGETPEQALIREIGEELSVEITVGTEFAHATGAWPISQTYCLRLYFATCTGDPQPGHSHDEIMWLTPGELGAIDWLPSDAQAVEILENGIDVAAREK